MGDTFIFMAALTDLDRQLLSALREDGRASVASLARQLGVARATVNSRLERLVSSGTIVGFTARVRDEVDPLAIRAIALIAVEGRSADRVIRQLRGSPRFGHCTPRMAAGTSWLSCARKASATLTKCWAGSAGSRGSSIARQACCSAPSCGSRLLGGDKPHEHYVRKDSSFCAFFQ